MTTQTPFITNCLVTIVHTKPVSSNFSPKIGCHGNVPQHLWTPIQHMIPTAHPSPQPKRHPYRFSCLCTDDRSVPILYNRTPILPQKFAPSHGGSGPPSNTWFPGPTQVLNRNGSSIGAAVFAGLTSVTNRPTDHATLSVGWLEFNVPFQHKYGYIRDELGR